MNITATRFATKARTWLLIAGLTGLLIAIGLVIGGGALYIFVGLAVLMNVVGYWFSDKIALKASRAQPVEPGTMPELEGIVQDLAQRARVPVPRLFLIPSEQPNAFATGRNPEHAAVAVTQGLLQHLPPDQVKGVLAHEFAHIKNRDILVSSIAAMVAGAISAIATVLQFSLLFGGDDEDSGPLGLIGTLATIILAPLAATLLQLAVSRQREYLADATGAQLLGRGGAAGERARDARARITGDTDERESGDGLALCREPASAERRRDPFHDPPADRRAHPQAARARRRLVDPLGGVGQAKGGRLHAVRPY